MKFDVVVVVPSRGRPWNMPKVINSFQRMESGTKKVHYVLLVDRNDDPSVEMAAGLAEGQLASLVVKPENDSLYHSINMIGKQMDTDVFMPFADDICCETKDWDVRVSVLPHLAFAWSEQSSPGHVTYVTFLRRWSSLLQHFPVWFPFWFADQWAADVYYLATGEPMPIIGDLRLTGDRGKCQGLRDLAFWEFFYAATCGERLRWAEILNIAGTNELAWTLHRQQGLLWGQEVISIQERFAGQQSEPSAKYLEMKNAAFRYMSELSGPCAPYGESRGQLVARLQRLSRERACYLGKASV